MKKFYQTTAAEIYPQYLTMRNITSLITVFYINQYFKCKNILEIGYYEGQTFGAMIEASAPGTQLTAIDPVFRNDLYNKYYRNSEHVKDKIINLLEIRFEDFQSSEKYDFINVDSGEVVDLGDVDRYDHLMKSLDLLHNNSILMLDNYNYPEANEISVDRFLKDQSKFVPFLIDGQALYFHTNNHDATDFLDNFLEETLASQFSLCNQDYKGFTVKHIEPFPVILDDFTEILPYFLRVKNV